MHEPFNYLIVFTKRTYNKITLEAFILPSFILLLQWAALFDGLMIEGKWLYNNQAPTSEDYLRNGIVTSGAPLVFLHLFFLLGHDFTEGNNDRILRIISCTAKIMRLWDDMGSAKVITYQELYHIRLQD